VAAGAEAFSPAVHAKLPARWLASKIVSVEMIVNFNIRWPGTGEVRADIGVDSGWVGADNLHWQCAPRQQSIGCDCVWAQGPVAGSHKSARMGRPVSKTAASVVNIVKRRPIYSEHLTRASVVRQGTGGKEAGEGGACAARESGIILSTKR